MLGAETSKLSVNGRRSEEKGETGEIVIFCSSFAHKLDQGSSTA